MADQPAHPPYDSDDEEEECRVCRGPAEEGRPLFKPCKCSGSIGSTHQDCLTSWLDVTRGDGKCELCSIRFKFAPQYAPGTPDTLPPNEVFLRLLRRFGAKWLPFSMRTCFVLSLWMIVLPLGTSYIYHSWMVKPTSVVDRWEYELMKRDVVGGGVISIIIVISFLSLMSFAEFLRFQWVGEEGAQQQQRQQHDVGDGPIEGEIDEIILPREDSERNVDDGDVDLDESKSVSFSRTNLWGESNLRKSNHDPLSPLDMAQKKSALDHANAWRRDHGLEPLAESDFDHVSRNPRTQNQHPAVEEPANYQFGENNNVEATTNEEDDLEEFLRAQEEQDLEEHAEIDDELPPQPGQNRRPMDDARLEPRVEPARPAFGLDQDNPDDLDMEINLALDELLGLRGPILAVVRNLLWLLVFNTAYLGIFALLPSSFGVAIYMLATKLKIVQTIVGALPGYETASNALIALNEKSNETRLIFQPLDIGQMGLGYLAFAVSVYFIRMVATVTLRKSSNNGDRPEEEENRKKMLLSVINGCAALVKVVVLLSIKMLVLPLSQGLCLDLITLPLFNKTLDDRIAFAGEDLFGTIFLYWDTGLAFMLFVTVSILQLREVTHPDILARFIRPQPPRPDVIGNMMEETTITHLKRIIMSLGIYIAFLTLHIWLPSRILLMNGMYELLPFFKPKYWCVIMPQIQFPIELLLFHYSTMNILERYKNNIGGLQHHWLHLLCNLFGFTDQILPKEIDKFKYVGSLPVFSSNTETHVDKATFSDKCSPKSKEITVDQFWNDLISEPDYKKKERLLRSRLNESSHSDQTIFEKATLRRDGKKVISNNAYIRFPTSSSDIKTAMKMSKDTSCLLPTCIGRYRLRQNGTKTSIPASLDNNESSKFYNTPIIEVYQEVRGNLIPRPPEGWDDLHGGSAKDGRWAWGDEHASDIEAGVATRDPFFDENTSKMINCAKFVIRMLALLIVSWAAITLLLLAILNVPLCIGRFIFHLIGVPDRYFHDPLAFAISVAFLIPMLECTAKIRDFKPLSWIKSFRPNESQTKTSILLSFSLQWFIICPILLGFLYSCFFLGFTTMLQDRDGVHNWLAIWGRGTFLLNLWAVMCFFSCFTKRFWVNFVMNALGDVVVQPNADGNQDEAAAARWRPRNNPRQQNDAHTDNPDARISWQGEDGAIGRCFVSFARFITGWEWDKLDEEAMLRNCVTPIFRQLLVSCLAPTIVTLMASFFYYTTIAKTARVVLITRHEHHSTATSLFRMIAISTATVQFLTSCKSGLQKWFEAVHKIARDDRYLIGEVLLNYSSTSSTS